MTSIIFFFPIPQIADTVSHPENACMKSMCSIIFLCLKLLVEYIFDAVAPLPTLRKYIFLRCFPSAHINTRRSVSSPTIMAESNLGATWIAVGKMSTSASSHACLTQQNISGLYCPIMFKLSSYENKQCGLTKSLKLKMIKLFEVIHFCAVCVASSLFFVLFFYSHHNSVVPIFKYFWQI